jgi:signal transduction histidine kinase
VGLVAAALLAVGIGVFIPRQVEKHMLQSEMAANTEVLQALLGTATLQTTEGTDRMALDRFVRQSILHGYFVRAKLWDLGGKVLYSDEPRLVGQLFPPGDDLRKAMRGVAQAEISDLSRSENALDQGLGSRLLEFYLPVRSGGLVFAVWEVYQSLHRFDAELGQIRAVVWASVGAGLLVLLVFLVSSFGSLMSTVQRRRREAEQRSRELGTLYDSLKASQGEQRRLTAELVSAHEEERKWVVGEIHDGLGQDLHTILFRLRGSRSGTPEEERDELERAEVQVEQSIVQLRRLLQDLRPSTLEDVGLVASLRGLADRAWQQHGLRVEVKADGVTEPPVPVRVAVFRIAQEALRNVVKHTAADQAEVELRRQAGYLTLRVSDLGAGGAASGEGEGLGIWLMRERAEALGGVLQVGSSKRGTTVTAHVPVEAP